LNFIYHVKVKENEIGSFSQKEEDCCYQILINFCVQWLV